MSGKMEVVVEDELPPAFSVWRVLHKTITIMFKNLDNYENNMETFIHTFFKSDECFDIFIWKYDCIRNFHENQRLERMYKAFTTWFLGRLFYLLSYEKFERIHNLIIEAQQKVLNILQLNQPQTYNSMVAEYNAALTFINTHLINIYLKTINPETNTSIIHNFIPDEKIIKKSELDLSPKFIELNTETSYKSLQQKLLQILTDISAGYVNNFWFDPISISIIKNIENSLQSSRVQSKIIVFDYITKILDQSYFQIKHSLFLNHFRNIFGFFSKYVVNLHNTCLNGSERETFYLSLNRLFTIVCKYEIYTKDNFINVECLIMAEYFVEQNFVFKNCKEIATSSMELLIKILTFENCFMNQTKLDRLITFVRDKKSCEYIGEILQYQILKEIQTVNSSNPNIVVYTASKTWELISNDINSLDTPSDLYKVFKYIKSVVNLAQNIYINFYRQFLETTSLKTFKLIFFPDNFIPNLLQLIPKISTTPEYQSFFVEILDIIHSILTFTSINKTNSSNFKNLISIVCLPFANEQPLKDMIKQINIVGFELENSVEIQMKTIDILSVSMMQIETTDLVYFDTIKTDIITIVQYCVAGQNNNIIEQVAHNYINLCISLRGNFEQLYNILQTLLSTKNAEVLKILTKSIGQIICLFAGNYLICPQKTRNNHITYKLECLHCDFTKVALATSPETYKICRKFDLKTFQPAQFIYQKNYAQLANFSFLSNLLDSEDVVIKRNMVGELPKIIKHVVTFNSNQITEKWLSFIVAEDNGVRMDLATVITLLINNSQTNDSLPLDEKKQILDTCLKTLQNLSRQHVRSLNVQLLETLLETIRQVGCLAYPEVVYTCTKLLIYYLIVCNMYISLIVINHLKHIAKAHNTTVNQLYIKYKTEFLRTFVEMSVYSYCSLDYTITQCLDRMALAFGLTTKDFITRDGHHMLPHFVPLFITAPNSQKILNEIAGIVVVEPADLLITNFSYIYTYIYLHKDENMLQKCMKYMETITKSSVAALKKRNIKVIYSELLLHFHDKRELVLTELNNLLRDESDSNPRSRSGGSSSSSSPINLQQIAEYLQPKFLGVLVYFDIKLVSPNVAESVKIRLLQNLSEIIKFMGRKYITSIRFKVLATLRTALSLTDEPYLELICNNWEAFVLGCDVDTLGPILSTIFVSILPLYAVFPRKINAIFKYLIVTNELKLKDYIQDLYFLLDTNTTNELKNIIRKHIKANKPDSFKDELALLLKYINHENLEIRVYGLKYLKKFLENKHNELEAMILGNNGMDAVIVELIDLLMTGCRENNKQVRLACGECLGELGAIEPSHFPRKYTQADSNFIFYITDDSFVLNALMELLRAFQMEKHAQNMNRFALAIQEILKAYNVSPDETATNHHLWSNFPDNMKELMLPLLSSRYTIAAQSDKITLHPICSSYLGATFNDWIYNWTSYLISILTNEQRALLQVCQPSLKNDYRTLMFFLPHILVHAILESSDIERTIIYDEMSAVLNFSNSEKKLNTEHLKYRGLKTSSYPTTETIKKTEDNTKNNYIKVIFVLLDYLNRWCQEFNCIKTPGLSTEISKVHHQTITNFLSLFCKLKIAECNFVRGEYPRALIYLEQYVSRDKTKLNEQLGFFARIYAELEEPDGVAGAMAIQEKEPSLEDMILAHNVTGQFQNAAACYERMAQECDFKPQYLREMVRCYIELDNPFTAFNIANGAMETHPEYKTMLLESQAEPFWRLSMYNELSDLVSKPEMKNNTTWGIRMGQALLHFRNGERPAFQAELANMRGMLVDMLSITSLEEGVFRHGYPHILKLHILNELEKAEATAYEIMNITNKKQSEQAINQLVDEWDVRIKMVHLSVRVAEPILRLRRIILEQTQYVLGPQAEQIRQTMNQHIAKYWLKSAEIARTASNFQQAYIYILKAEPYKPMALFIEKAKLYWAKEENELAFSTLKRGIEEHFPDAATFKDMDATYKKAERKICAEAKLLIAIYNDETSNVETELNIANYKTAVDVFREWEKSQVHLAQYYDRVFSTMSDDEKDMTGGDVQVHIINCFGKSLQYGSHYIYQSMPRMLSIWFDYGTRILASRPTDDSSTRETKKRTLLKMIKLMDTYLDRLPAYMFLSAFSQLVSRICHPVPEVYHQIKSIVLKLILKYPQQSMWAILAVSKSAYTIRKGRCQELFQDQRLKSSNVMKLVYDFNKLAEKLIDLCNKPIADGVLTTSVNTLNRTLPRLLQNKDFSEIILPIQKFRKLVLPNPESCDNQYNPFPNKYVYIVGIEDEISVLQSLQRPRKIIFRGSDGNKYIHMLKPKDDLRKDCRLMEFNDVVNMYLHHEPESRERRLYIRTYSVVPLNEECGIVEWVDNLIGLRPILMKIYKQKGLYVSPRELKAMMCNPRDPLVKKRQMYEQKLLPKHPPVLSEWFRRTFPDASFWHQARTAYIRTSAVMSMAGYILGLGDRHGENILFDSTNGDTVHVDFNCLFNKGEMFDCPERVPFRLTPNMVEAMGPLGVEGIFRKTCAVTLNVLRIHKDTLMSIVRPFVYDPLVSWPRNHPLRSEQAEAERTNEQAVEHIRNIELRLEGMTIRSQSSFSTSLSCEGQANKLIADAISIDNLSQMYIGWGPFL